MDLSPWVRPWREYRPGPHGPVDREIRDLLPECCRSKSIDIRPPSDVIPDPDNMLWHQDGGGPEGVYRHMVVWASEDPTEFAAIIGQDAEVRKIRAANPVLDVPVDERRAACIAIHREVEERVVSGAAIRIDAEPYQMFILSNDWTFHRQSTNDQTQRWFIGVRCDGVVYPFSY